MKNQGNRKYSAEGQAGQICTVCLFAMRRAKQDRSRSLAFHRVLYRSTTIYKSNELGPVVGPGTAQARCVIFIRTLNLKLAHIVLEYQVSGENVRQSQYRLLKLGIKISEINVSHFVISLTLKEQVLHYYIIFLVMATT